MRHAAALLLLALLAPTALASAPRPTLSQGDFWERAQGDTVMLEVVQGFETVRSGAGSYDAVRLVEWTRMREGAQAPSPPPGAGGLSFMETTRTSWLRVSDHAYLKSRTESNGSATAGYSEHGTTPCEHLRWPLEVGAEWTFRCTTETDTGARGTDGVFHRRVVARGNVTVPAGTFDSYVVETRLDNATGPLVNREWHAPAACGWVRAETYDEGAPRATELLRHRCLAPPAGSTPTPQMIDTCSGVPYARCTPGPGPLVALAAVALVALLARRRA